MTADGDEEVTSDKVLKLLEVKKIIDRTLAQYNEDIQLLTASQVAATDELLKMSLQIRHTSHAPREYKIGFPLINGHPPAPQPEQMRAGRLPAFNLKHSIEGSGTRKNEGADQPRGQLFTKRLLDELLVAKEKAVILRNTAMTAAASDEKMDMSEPPADTREERTTEEVSMPESKKSRTVNISFASYDDSDED
jgi:hypothetical protein